MRYSLQFLWNFNLNSTDTHRNNLKTNETLINAFKPPWISLLQNPQNFLYKLCPSPWNPPEMWNIFETSLVTFFYTLCLYIITPFLFRRSKNQCIFDMTFSSENFQQWWIFSRNKFFNRCRLSISSSVGVKVNLILLVKLGINISYGIVRIVK